MALRHQDHRLGVQRQDSPCSPAHSRSSSTFSCPPWHSFGVSRGNCLQGKPQDAPPVPGPQERETVKERYLQHCQILSPQSPCSQAGLALYSARSPVIKVITDLFLLWHTAPPTTQHFPRPHSGASSLPGLNPQTQCPHGRDCPQRLPGRWTEAATRSESPLPGTPLSPQGKNQYSSRGSGRLPQTTGCKRCPEGTRAAFSRQLKEGRPDSVSGVSPTSQPCISWGTGRS